VIRRFCKWYTDKFPEKRKPGWYPAETPWQVKVIIKNLDGITTVEETIDYDQDRYDRFSGYEVWDRAEVFARDAARKIKEKGFTNRTTDGVRHYYPVHRIHKVEAYANTDV